MIEIADSWQGRDGSPIVSIPVDSFEAGDLIVVYSFAFGGSPGVPTDDGGNVYTVRTQTTADGTFDSVVSISDAIVDTVPTQVEVTNTAGGANDTGIVVLRVTHNGTGWTSSNYVLAGTVTGTGPTTGAVTVGDATPAPFSNEGGALYLAGLTHDGATTTFTAGTGWATVEEEEDASLIPYSVVSKVEIASGPQTHQWAVGASRDFAYVIAAYTENIPDPVLELVTVAPVPSVTGLGITVSNPGRFPDPDLGTFTILTHPEGDELFVPTLLNAEILRVVAWDTATMPPEDWEIERAQVDGNVAQNIEVGWWVWWDHIYTNDPLGLLEYVASIQLTAVAGGIGDVAGDIEDIETEVETIGDDVDAVEADMDAVEVLVEKLRVIARTVYTSGSGTHTYDDDMASVQFIVCGGGGAGGDAPDDGVGSTAGSGGGGGGVAQKMVIRTGEASCTYAVGAAGSGSTVSHAALTISGNAGSTGVNGISSPSAHAGGAGGTATGGDMNSKGQAGSPSISIGDQHAMSGNGGSSVMGGGGVGGVTTSAGGGANGGAGGNYGGGGGGGCAGGSTTRVGGAGAAGIIIIEEYGIGV